MSSKKNTKKSSSGLNMGVVGAVLAVAAIGAVLAVIFMKPNALDLEFQKGMGYCTWSESGYNSESSDVSLDALKTVGADHVAILTTWYQTNCWSGDIKRKVNTPSDESVVHAINKAHELGLKVMLKPHLDIIDKSDGSWRGEIGCIKEGDWQNWFKGYEKFIMHYAKIAEDNGVELFCIGTELSNTVTTKGYMWKDVIAKIRSVYKGHLTYAAHWDRFQDIRFWSDLDYVGINAYFPLSEKMQPTYDELKEGWSKWIADMETFQAKVKKPIIFPEIGCNSADGSAIRPWEHSPRREVNLQLQKDYYQVLIDIFFDKDWFYGLYWWYWGTNSQMGGEFNRGFTPQNKPAQKVLEETYAKTIMRRKKF